MANTVKLEQSRKIERWMEENKRTTPPSAASKNEAERKLGQNLHHIKEFIKKYLDLETEEEKEEFRKQYPEIEEIIEIVNRIEPIYLQNAKEIKRWMQLIGKNRKPSRNSKNETERMLARKLHYIKIVIKNYNNLSPEEQEGYKKKHPEIEEVIEIVDWIDKNSVSKQLINVRKVREWMKEKNTDKPPTIVSQNLTEKKLGRAYQNAKSKLIKPFYDLETEEEKEEYRKQHPELEEVMEIVKKIETNNPRKNGLRKAKEKRDIAIDEKEKAKKLQEEVMQKINTKEGITHDK